MLPYNVITVRDYYPHKNNPISSIWVYDQVKGLKKYGYNVLVVSPTPYIPFFLRKQNKYRFFPKPNTKIENYLGTEVIRPSYLKIPNYYMYSLTQRSLMRASLKSTNGCCPKLLHAHFGNNGIACVALKRKYKIPLITSFYGYDAGRLAETFKPYYKDLIQEGELFLALSKDMKQDLIRIGFHEEKIRILHLGVDTIKFKERKKNTDKFIFLVVARLDESKGVQDVIKAFCNVYKKYKQIELRIVGQGSYLPNLIRQVEELQLNDAVKFIDNLATENPRGTVLEQMSTCDVFLLTSYTTASGSKEGTPVVLMEAQSCSKPCISTFHAGIPEVVIDKETGLLVNERDTGAIAKNMKKFIEDNNLRRTMGRSAQKHVEMNFNQDKQISKLAKIYDELIKR